MAEDPPRFSKLSLVKGNDSLTDEDRKGFYPVECGVCEVDTGVAGTTFTLVWTGLWINEKGDLDIEGASRGLLCVDCLERGKQTIEYSEGLSRIKYPDDFKV